MLNEGFKRPIGAVIGCRQQQRFFTVEAAYVRIEAVEYGLELRRHAVIIKWRDEHDDVGLEQVGHELLLNRVV